MRCTRHCHTGLGLEPFDHGGQISIFGSIWAAAQFPVHNSLRGSGLLERGVHRPRAPGCEAVTNEKPRTGFILHQMVGMTQSLFHSCQLAAEGLLRGVGAGRLETGSHRKVCNLKVEVRSVCAMRQLWRYS